MAKPPPPSGPAGPNDPCIRKTTDEGQGLDIPQFLRKQGNDPRLLDRLDLLAQQIGQISQHDAGRLADILALRGVPRDTALGVLMVAAGWGWERTKEMRGG